MTQSTEPSNNEPPRPYPYPAGEIERTPELDLRRKAKEGDKLAQGELRVRRGLRDKARSMRKD